MRRWPLIQPIDDETIAQLNRLIRPYTVRQEPVSYALWRDQQCDKQLVCANWDRLTPEQQMLLEWRCEQLADPDKLERLELWMKMIQYAQPVLYPIMKSYIDDGSSNSSPAATS